MKNNNNDAMKNYFDSMLRNDDKSNEESPEFAEPSELNEQLVFSSPTINIQKEPEIESVEKDDEWENLVVADQFQVLFFELNHITFAIPLTDLGGIYHLTDSLNFLMGKPAWFRGVMSHNERLYNIVDTSSWLQLGRNATDLNYTHFILLGDTA